MSVLDEIEGDYERADALVYLLIDRATGGPDDEDGFQVLRRYFSGHPKFAESVPQWFRSKRSLNQFWHFIKNRYSTYAERREYLWNEFEPLLGACELGEKITSETEISDVLEKFDSVTVARTWRHMIQGVQENPEGAITKSRSLIESVCKHILDHYGIDYNDSNVEFSVLYKKTAKELNLSPDQHSEQVFKQILGSCSGVVSGLGSLRNKLGDAHGKGKCSVKPSPRHAKLAVNLAGAFAQFLVETYIFRKQVSNKGAAGDRLTAHLRSTFCVKRDWNTNYIQPPNLTRSQSTL